MSDQTIKIGLLIDGQQGVRDASGRVAELKTQLKQLEDQERQGYYTSAQTARAKTDLSRQIRAAEKDYTAATRAAAAYNTTIADAHPKMQTSAQGFRANAMGVLYLSQAVEDLQYGVGAVVNNIPLMAMSLGAGPGLAGVVSLAAVGVSLLSKHWGEWTGQLEASLTPMDRAKKTLQEIGAAGGINPGSARAGVLAQGAVATITAGQGVGEMFGTTPSSMESARGAGFTAGMFGETPVAEQAGLKADLVKAATDMRLMRMGLGRGDRTNIAGQLQEVEKKVAEDIDWLLGKAKMGDAEAIETIASMLDAVGDRRGRTIRLAVKAAEDKVSGWDDEIARDQAESARRLEKKAERQRQQFAAAVNAGQAGALMGGAGALGGLASDVMSEPAQRERREMEARAERERGASKRLDRMKDDRLGRIQADLGIDPEAIAARVAQGTIGRQYGGMGWSFNDSFMNTRRELVDQLQRPMWAGGAGLSKADATEVSARLMAQAQESAMQQADQLRYIFPRGTAEMQRVLQQHVMDLRTELREGVRMYLGKARR